MQWHSQGHALQEMTSTLDVLQICTACAMSFAHGSNDVANSIGPYSTIYNIWSTSTVPKKAEVPEWILVLGGAGIVLGLATYGQSIVGAPALSRSDCIVCIPPLWRGRHCRVADFDQHALLPRSHIFACGSLLE